MRFGNYSLWRCGLRFAVALLVCFPAACANDNPVDSDDDEEPIAPPSLCSDAPGTICTWAGTGDAGWDGDGNVLLLSTFYWPVDVMVTHEGRVYVLDWNNHRVRRAAIGDSTLETAIGSGLMGDGSYAQSERIPPGAPGRSVNLSHPTHLVQLSGGAYLLTAWRNHKLRIFDPVGGRVRVFVGATPGFAGDGGPAEDAILNHPSQTVLAPGNTLFVLDQRNLRVRKIDANSVITTVAGTGTAGFIGDGGPPRLAQLNLPAGNSPRPAGGLALGPDGNLYISDTLNQRIRRVDFERDVIETVAGTGAAGFSGDGGPAEQAMLNNPRDIQFGRDGRLYVADEMNHRIRAIDLASGTITTVAGNGQPGFSGDGGPATAAALNRPAGVAFDEADGLLYIADTYNHRIRLVTLSGS